MLKVKTNNVFDKTEAFLDTILVEKNPSDDKLKEYGQLGCDILKEHTPKKTGLTSESWTYKIIKRNGAKTIQWKNTNIQNGQEVAMLIFYGHATSRGLYIEGRDYINPAMKELMEILEQEMKKNV